MVKPTSRAAADVVARRGCNARGPIGTRCRVASVYSLRARGALEALKAGARVGEVAHVVADAVLARVRVAGAEAGLAAEARVAGQAGAVVAVEVVGADAVVLAWLADAGEYFLRAQLARVAGQASARELAIGSGRAEASVETRRRGTYVDR